MNLIPVRANAPLPLHAMPDMAGGTRFSEQFVVSYAPRGVSGGGARTRTVRLAALWPAWREWEIPTVRSPVPIHRHGLPTDQVHQHERPDDGCRAADSFRRAISPPPPPGVVQGGRQSGPVIRGSDIIFIGAKHPITAMPIANLHQLKKSKKSVISDERAPYSSVIPLILRSAAFPSG